MSEKEIVVRVEDVTRRYIKAYGLKPNAVMLGHAEWDDFRDIATDRCNPVASMGRGAGQFCRIFDMVVLPVSCDEYLSVGRIEPE